MQAGFDFPWGWRTIRDGVGFEFDADAWLIRDDEVTVTVVLRSVCDHVGFWWDVFTNGVLL